MIDVSQITSVRNTYRKYLFQLQMAGKPHFPAFNTNESRFEKKCLKHVDCIKQFEPNNNEKTLNRSFKCRGNRHLKCNV